MMFLAIDIHCLSIERHSYIYFLIFGKDVEQQSVAVLRGLLVLRIQVVHDSSDVQLVSEEAYME